MAWQFMNQNVGMPPITDTRVILGTGVLKPWRYGDIQKAVDPTYGVGEFIYLKGAANCVAGLVWTYDIANAVVIAVASGALARGHPVCVSMAAITALLAGWFQIGGNAIVLKTAVKVDPAFATGMNVHLSGTAGRVMQTSVASRQIIGARFATLVTISSTTSTAVVTLNRPVQQGRIT